VYGSVASGKEHPGSDVDIAVLDWEALTVEKKDRLAESPRGDIAAPG